MTIDEEQLIQRLRGLDPAAGLKERLSAPELPASLSVDVLIGAPPEMPYRGRARRRLAGVLAGVALIGGLAASPVGASIADVASNFAGFLGGGDPGELAGTEISPGELPPQWLSAGPTSDPRLLAERDDWKLVVAREGEALTFAFDGGEAVGSRSWWASRLRDQPVYLLAAPVARGPQADSQRPLFGIVAGDVATVRAIYADGSASRPADASAGGFVLLLDRDRDLSAVAAYDEGSRRVGSVDSGAFAEGHP